MKKIILFPIFWAIWLTGLSQDVVVDSITGVIKSELPFDREFYLPFRHDADKTIQYLHVSKKRNGSASSFTNWDNKRAQLIYGENNVQLLEGKDKMLITLSDTFVRKVKTGSLVYIFPLSPSTSYEFRVGLSNFSYSKEIRQAIVLAQNILANPSELETDIKQIDSIIAHSLDNDEYDKVIAFTIYKGHVVHNTLSLLSQDKRVEAILTKEKIIYPVHLSSFVTCYLEHLTNLMVSDSQSVYNRLLIHQIENTPFLLLDENEVLLNIQDGFLKITDSNLQKAANQFDYKARIENLKATYAIIEKFLRIEQFSASGNCTDFTILKELKAKITHLSEVYSLWTALIKDYTVKKEIADIKLFSTTTYVGFSGGSTTLDSKGKFIARPDMSASVATDGKFARVMPSIGVRFNFRPLDPNLPYRQIMKKGFAHRSSLSLSFTTNSIADGSTRFDLFGKTNLVLDYGFRLNNAFNISAGILVFKRADPNPFISSQKLAVLPTIGISLDFEIIEAINDVKKVLTGK